jgi:ribosomal protein S18 acetylase RimI-like enzyme
MDARIQQSVVANLSHRPRPVEVGPFVIGFDPGTDNPGINYATPVPGAAITGSDVQNLVAAFREAARKPRLEYVVSTAPRLEALLTAAGFTVEARHDYLICGPGMLTPPPATGGVDLREPSTGAERLAMSAAQLEAFGADPASAGADSDRLARLQSAGGVAVMAVAADGACAGGGQAVPPRGAVSEVAGIAVVGRFRRRGLGGAITADITERLFATGVDVAWLEASGEDAWRVYERIGYRPAGKRLYIALD